MGRSGGGTSRGMAVVAARSMRYPSAAAVTLSGGTPDRLVPVDQPIAAIVEQLNALQPDAIITGCSMLGPLVDEVAVGRLRLKLDRIILGGDVLDRATVERAKRSSGSSRSRATPQRMLATSRTRHPASRACTSTTTS